MACVMILAYILELVCMEVSPSGFECTKYISIFLKPALCPTCCFNDVVVIMACYDSLSPHYVYGFIGQSIMVRRHIGR